MLAAELAAGPDYELQLPVANPTETQTPRAWILRSYAVAGQLPTLLDQGEFPGFGVNPALQRLMYYRPPQPTPAKGDRRWVRRESLRYHLG